MIKSPIALAGAIAATLLLTTLPGHAQTTKLVNTFKDWAKYAHSGAPADICFITSQPKEASPPGTRGDRSFFYVSSWPNDGVKAEISLKIGRPLKQGSAVTVQIGNNRFALFTKGDKAFVSDPTDELKLIDAMKRGSFMVVKATKDSGQETTETYSLLGVTQGLNSLTQGCGE